MSDAHEGVPVEIGGRERVLRFNLKSLGELHKATGRNPFENGEGNVLDEINNAPTPDLLAAFIWSMLYREDPRPSLDDVAEWITFQDMARIMTAAGEAQTRNLPERKAGSAKGPPVAGRRRS